MNIKDINSNKVRPIKINPMPIDLLFYPIICEEIFDMLFETLLKEKIEVFYILKSAFILWKE